MDYSYPIRVAANKFPYHTALVFRDRALSFEELDRAVDVLAANLLSMGLAGTRVASICLNEPETVCLYMALARIGATSVPVNVRLTAQEKEWIIRDSGATALVFDGQYAEEASTLRERIPGLERLIGVNAAGSDDPSDTHLEELLQRSYEGEIDLGVDEGAVATVMYTSGTTGLPKGVMRTQRANLWNVVNSALGSPRNPEDVEVFTLPIFGIGFLHFAMPALLGGATVVLDRAFDPERTWELLDQHEATRTFLAPTMVDSMLSVSGQEQYELPALEIIYSAYEFPERLRRRAIERFGPRFVYMYGLTEAQLTCARPGEFAADPTSAGKPMGLMRIAIVDDDGNLLPPGQVGEIAFEGPSAMEGYHGSPEATAEALRNGWVHTGDLGYLDDARNVHFAGRKKEIIKTGGFSVDPVEVENALLALDELREVAVVGVPDDHWGEKVVAFAVLQAGTSLTEGEVIADCKRRVADFKVPKRVVFIDELPKNPTGKVERGRLRHLWQQLEGK